MIISIFASIWAQNLWDELILKNQIKILEKKYWKNTEFLVFSYDYKNPFFIKKNIKYLPYFPDWIKKIKNILINIFNFFNFLKIIIKSDLIIIGWWGLFFDNEIWEWKNSLYLWNFRLKILKFLRKKIEFFRIWINIKQENNLKLIKNIFSWNNIKISVRDNYSFSLLKDLWIKSKIKKDPVFYDNWINKQKKSFLIKKIKSKNFNLNNLKDIDFKWKKIALALRSWYFWKNEEKKINLLIDFLLEKKWKIILLPHSFSKGDILLNDYIFLKKFLRINKNIRIIHSIKDVYSKYIYKEFDICFAMRLHSIILSQVYKIKFIWFSYSIKTLEILKNINK